MVSSRALVLACERMGIDGAALLQAVGIERATLEDPDARVPLDQVRTLWARAEELSGDPFLALHAAENLPAGAYKVIDLMALCAPTVGQGIAQVSAYFPLINSAVRLPIEVGAGEVAMSIEAPSAPAMLTRPYVEYTFAAVFLRNRAGAGFDFSPKRVEFSHAPPHDTSEHERIFGCPVLFHAQACRLLLPVRGHGLVIMLADQRAAAPPEGGVPGTATSGSASPADPRTPG